MLQPMQPVGQQQKPGANIGMPRAPGQMAPGQQMMPAGAAMQQGILPGGIASNPEDIKAAYGGTPQGRAVLQQAADKRDYLSAIALAQILEEEREKAAAKAAQANQGGKPPPVIDRMQDEAVDLRRQDLEEQQVKRLGMENQRSQQAMAQMAGQAARPQMQGVAGLPAQNVAQPQAMAAGGIVAFNGKEDGSYVGNSPEVIEKVSEEVVRPVGANPYAGLSNKQILEKFGREQLGANRAEAERRAREEYMKFAGYTPEEKARQERRLSQIEEYDRQAYNPERLRNEGINAFLMGAANTGGIGETFARAGQSGLNYSNKMRELARQRMSDRQKQAEAWDEAQRGARVKGYEAGTTEGKEVLAGQRQGIAGLGDALQYEASLARTAQSGSGGQSKEEARVAAMIARDPYIGTWQRALTQMEKDGMSNTPEYNALIQKIAEREGQYYKRANVEAIEPPPLTQPEEKPKKEGGFWSGLGNLISGIGGGAQRLQSGEAGKSQAMPLPAQKSQLIAGQMYNTRNGPARWNGTEFEQ